MKKIILFVLATSISLAQNLKDPDYFLVPNKYNLPKIFLVGCFHFEYYNLDANKTAKEKQIDILSEQKQKELKALLDYISIFKPTKILIEATPEYNAMKRFKRYKSGEKQLKKDEREQIGFRLAERFKLDTIFSVDSPSIADDLSESKDSMVIRPYLDEVFKDYKFKSNENYTKYSEYQTELELKLSLLDYFKYLNSPAVLIRDYGAYLLGDFKLGEYRGADALAIDWYNRNLRIFRNIQKVTTSKNDRILVLFGSGHISILDQLLNCSPEYNYIKFNDLKK